MTENYDVIIIGSGAGGGTLAYDLAGSGKNILLLERGDFLPREPENWDPKQVFVEGRYISKDTWFDRDGPGAGNTHIGAMRRHSRATTMTIKDRPSLLTRGGR